MKIPVRVFGLMVAGMGLIMIGITAWFLLTQQSGRRSDTAHRFFRHPGEVQYDAPALTLNDIHGTSNSLSNYRGQVVLVNLWATWCPPCKAEMPLLQEYYLNHKNEGFTVIAIEDGDPTPDVLSFVEGLWPHVSGLARPNLSGYRLMLSRQKTCPAHMLSTVRAR